MNKEGIAKCIERSTTRVNDCWLWNGFKNPGGYGKIQIKRKKYLVHRLSAYAFLDFDLGSQLNVNHKLECPNRHCCNPDHLYIGTQHDNIIDWLRARKDDK